MFKTFQTAITRNSFVELVDCHEIWPEHFFKIEEQKGVEDFSFYMEHFSCGRRERSRVGNYSIL